MPDDFNQRYAKALEGLSPEQVAEVVNLGPFERLEWVDSPAAVRPFLLEKWRREKEEHQRQRDELKKKYKKRWYHPF